MWQDSWGLGMMYQILYCNRSLLSSLSYFLNPDFSQPLISSTPTSLNLLSPQPRLHSTSYFLNPYFPQTLISSTPTCTSLNRNFLSPNLLHPQPRLHVFKLHPLLSASCTSTIHIIC